MLRTGGAALAGGALLPAERRAALAQDVPGAAGPRAGTAVATGGSRVGRAPVPPAEVGTD